MRMFGWRTSTPLATGTGTATVTGMAAVTARCILIARMDTREKKRRWSRMTRTLAPALLAATLLAVAFMPTARPQTGGEPSNAAPPAAQPLVIGSGDLVDVSVMDAPELSGHFRVDHRGDMQVPLLDVLHVAGLTAEQAAKLIQDQYVQAKILVPEAARPTVFIEE